MASAPSATSKRVGKFLTIAAAAHAIHADPANLAQARTPEFADPANPTVAELTACKRELFAIFAHLSRLVMLDLEAGIAAKAGPTGLVSGESETPIEPERLQAVSFHPELSASKHDGDYYQYADHAAVNTMRTVLASTDGSLATTDQAPVVARAAHLMSLLPSKNHERRSGEENNDVAYVLRNIRQGAATSYEFSADLLRALPLAVAKANPTITCDELLEIARASTGLIRAPAGMNMPQFSQFHDTIRTELPSESAIEEWNQWAEHRRAPKNAREPNRRENRPGQKPTPVEPEHLVPGANGRRTKYIVGNPLAAPAITKDDKLTTVASWIRDEFGLPSVDGCPARIEAAPGQLSPLVRSYYQMINIVEHHWRLTVPHNPPIDLCELEQPIDPFQTFDTVRFTDLGDYKIQVLPSATGAVSVELAGEASAEDLQITADNGTLSIRGNHRAIDPTANKTLIVRTPAAAAVQARDFAKLQCEFNNGVDVDVAAEATVVAKVQRKRNDAATPNRILLADRASALLVGEQAKDAGIVNDSGGGRSAVFIDTLGVGLPTNGVETLSLNKLITNDPQPLTPAGAQLLEANIDFAMRHTARGWPPLIHRRMRKLAVAHPTDHARDREVASGQRRPSPQRPR